MFQRMYADIEEVAWPSTLQDAQIETLPCGSLRILSQDEYASLTLPLHKRDFTVEYLAKHSSVSDGNSNSEFVSCYCYGTTKRVYTSCMMRNEDKTSVTIALL